MVRSRQVLAFDRTVSGSQIIPHPGAPTCGQTPDVIQERVGNAVGISGKPVADKCTAESLAGLERSVVVEFVYETSSCWGYCRKVSPFELERRQERAAPSLAENAFVSQLFVFMSKIFE
eukprot:8098203-Pyramimonas_sp.AAC.1